LKVCKEKRVCKNRILSGWPTWFRTGPSVKNYAGGII